MSILLNTSIQTPGHRNKHPESHYGNGCLFGDQCSWTGGVVVPGAFLENRRFENSATHMLRNLTAQTGAFFARRVHFGTCGRLKILQLHKTPIKRLDKSHEVSGCVLDPYQGVWWPGRDGKGVRRRSLGAIWGRFGEPLGSNREHSPLKIPRGKQMPLPGSPSHVLSWLGSPSSSGKIWPNLFGKYGEFYSVYFSGRVRRWDVTLILN